MTELKGINLKKPITTICFSLTALLGIASCGDIPTEAGGRSESIEQMVGAVKNVDPEETLSREELELLADLCADLERKERLFSDYADTRTKLRYSSFTKGCGEEAQATEQGPFEVQLRLDGGRVVFESQNGEPPFQYAVSQSDYLMGKVCGYAAASLAALSEQEDGLPESQEQAGLPPRALANGSDPVWISAYSRGSAQCGEGFENHCVYLSTGIPVQEGSSRHRIRDVKFYAVKAKADDPLRGVVAERVRFSLCDGGSSASRGMSFLSVVE